MSHVEQLPPGIVFDLAARVEFAEAVAWHDQQRNDLGTQFILEVRRALKLIHEHPSAWAKLSARSRRCRLARFKYGIIYQQLPEEIRILLLCLNPRPAA